MYYLLLTTTNQKEVLKEGYFATLCREHGDFYSPERLGDNALIVRGEFTKDREFSSYISIDDRPTILERYFNTDEIDFNIFETGNKPAKLLIADLESTIIEEECLDELAKHKDCEGEMKAITHMAMEYELDFESALKERVELLKGLPVEKLEELRENLTITSGAKELIATMKKNGSHCVLVSGGFNFFVEHIAKKLKFDEWYCNDIEIKDGKLTGKVKQATFRNGEEIKKTILDAKSKDNIMREIVREKNIPEGSIIAVGDGANDMLMLKTARHDNGFGVAFHGKRPARMVANIRIDHSDLTALLYLQGYKQSDFVKV